MPRSIDPQMQEGRTEEWLHAVGQDLSEYRRILSVVLLSAACALLIWSAVWIAVPRSHQSWRTANVVLGLFCATGPSLAAMASLHELFGRRPIENRPVRFLIAFAILGLVSIALLFTSFARVIAADALNSTAGFPILAAPGLVLALAVVGAIRLLLPAPPARRKRERILHGLIVASVAGPFAGLLLWSVLNIALVEWRASAIAGTDPYCLQVPTGSIDYETVTEWSQLSGLRMQTPFEESGGATSHEWQWAFHAVLVVKSKGVMNFYNWSYAAQNFVPLPKDTQGRTHVLADCAPKQGFLYSLDGF